MGGLGSLKYNMMKWDKPMLALDSLWPVWEDTEPDMSENVDILTLTPDSLWVVQADNVGYVQWVSENDYTQGYRD